MVSEFALRRHLCKKIKIIARPLRKCCMKIRKTFYNFNIYFQRWAWIISEGQEKFSTGNEEKNDNAQQEKR
jgi:hypothetical protein